MTNRGQSLFEVVVALAISALIIVALVALVSSAIRNATYSKNNSLAASFAQEATEWLRGERDNDANTFLANTQTPVWCLPDLNWDIPGTCISENAIPGTPFIRQVSFAVSQAGGKTVIEANVTVSWQDSQGSHQVASATNFTDWRQR